MTSLLNLKCFYFLQIVANATFNNELMNTDLTLMDGMSKLVIGEGFVGCMLEGPSLIFNNSISEKYNIEWGRCSHVPCKYSIDYNLILLIVILSTMKINHLLVF